MVWLLAIPAILLGLLLLVAAVPFHARATGAVHDGEVSGAVWIGWGWGLLSVNVAAGGAAVRVAGVRVVRLDGRRGGKRSAPAEKERRDAGGERWAGRLRRSVRARRPLLRMAARLARALRLRLRLAGSLGAGDPADTAALVALARLLEAVPGVELPLEFDWLDEVVELEAEGSARIWVAELAAAAAVLLLERENRAALRVVFS